MRNNRQLNYPLSLYSAFFKAETVSISRSQLGYDRQVSVFLFGLLRAQAAAMQS
ncbi:MAG: hypothetical protein GW823_01980 [Bacteroidetes bacterium]|nr:hypothetical protein [Bacteroidota bacterium]